MKKIQKISIFVMLLFSYAFANNTENVKAIYITDTLPMALTLELIYNIPIELTLAQSALESAWGQSYNAKYRCNYFGITKLDGHYKVFNSKKESFDYYGKLMSTRYADCLSLNYKETIECIKKKGYAEDEHYTRKLKKMFRQMDARV